MNKVKWGIIGPGKIAHRFADGLKECFSGELVSIASKTEEHLNSFGDKYGIKEDLRFNNYEQIIETAEIDALYISTPHNLHAEWTINAVNNGKHVLCEKPACVNYLEGKKVIDTVKKAGVFYMEGFMYRCHPQIKKVLKLIESNTIGKIELIKSSFCFNIGDINPQSRLFNIDLAGGAILDVGLYPVSFSRLIAGAASKKFFLNPYKIEGSASFFKTGVDERSQAILYFENDIKAEVYSAITKDEDDKAIIKGTEGSISIISPWTLGKDGGPYESAIIIKKEDNQKTIRIQGPEHLFSFEAEIASQSIIEKKTEAPYPAMTWDDTLGNLAALDSWRKAIGYKLPVDNEH